LLLFCFRQKITYKKINDLKKQDPGEKAIAQGHHEVVQPNPSTPELPGPTISIPALHSWLPGHM
jgi:hypothetical protein